MPASTPSERQLIARTAAHLSWAYTQNRTARTARARDAFLARFDDDVDPRRDLTAEERSKRATNARKAYFADLARRSAGSRRARGAQRQALDELAEATLLLAASATPPPTLTARPGRGIRPTAPRGGGAAL